MKVTARVSFKDYKAGITRQPGEGFDVTEERLKELLGTPYGDLVEVKPADVQKVETKTVKKPQVKKGK